MKLCDLFAVVALAAPTLALQSPAKIEVFDEEGEQYCTVHARNIPANLLIEAVTKKLGRELRWNDEIQQFQNVTVHLDKRYADEALRTIVGAAGLRAKVNWEVVAVSRDFNELTSPDEMVFAAELAYNSALNSFPEHELRVGARSAMAELQRERGELDRAAQQYGYLIDEYLAYDFPEAEAQTTLKQFLPEALVRAGRLLTELRRWDAAKQRFQTLVNLPDAGPYFAEGLRELARAQCWLGDTSAARYMIRALKSNPEFAPQDDMDHAQRLLVEARALLDSDPVGSLRCLDETARLRVVSFTDFEAMEIRARALENAGRPTDAAHAWLGFFADVEDESLRKEALVRAANLSLNGVQDELAVLFIAKLAERAGFEGLLDSQLNQARTRLGLETPTIATGSIEERLARAEDFVVRGLWSEARTVLELLYAAQRLLDGAQRLQLALRYSEVLEAEEDVDTAMEVLRSLVLTVEGRDARATLYIHAGEMFERHERFDEAADAYGGKL